MDIRENCHRAELVAPENLDQVIVVVLWDYEFLQNPFFVGDCHVVRVKFLLGLVV
jgi:hypothetical protein